MTRRDHCRQVSPDHLRACGVSEQIIKELEQTRLFTEEHPDLCDSSTRAIKAVMDIPDEDVKAKVISSVEKSLESGKDPLSGKFTKKKAVTETQVKKIIAKITNNCPYFLNGICEKRIGPFKIPKPCEHLEPDRLSAKGCTLTGNQPLFYVPYEKKPETIAPSPPSEKLSGPKEVDPATVATIAGVLVEQAKPITNTDELNAHLKAGYEASRPSDKTGPFTQASEIPKGLVDLNTPDTRTDPVPFTPVHPIARTDPLDKANGVVKMQTETTDYETLAKEGLEPCKMIREEGGCRRSGGPCTLTDDQRQKYSCHLSGNLIGLHVEDARTTQDFPSTLVLKSPPNPVQSPPVVPEIVTITPTRGMWRAVDNAIKRGEITADEKAGKDAWQVGAMRVFEAGCETLENGGRSS